MSANGFHDPGAKGDGTLRLAPGAVDRLMPMYLWLTPSGHVRAVGSTLAKLIATPTPVGQRFLELFRIRRPRNVETMADLMRLTGERLHLDLRAAPRTGFRGIAMPLVAGQGALVNLSFGIEVAEAVRRHELTSADFAPTDLTVEMLYLDEAKSAVMQELHDLNIRLQQAKALAERQALTDTLTGLANRRAMDAAIERLIATGVTFGLMNVDLDFFKEVNDSLGHAAGDHVLKVMARILRDETRKSDIVARVGGDEFVLIFPGIGQVERLQAIAARIIARLAGPIDFRGRPCRVAASIGVTVSSRYTPPRAERILRDADRALYASKLGGRSRATVYSPDLADMGQDPPEGGDAGRLAPGR